jgi:protein-S-isoprenylcysteine O-methyltransferase Ste14
MPAPKLKIPPPLVALATALLMWLIARAAPMLTLAMPAHRFVAACIAAAGVAVAAMGIVQFRRARTTVNPLHPERASSLVTSGIYRLTRNPMYLGLLLALIAWAIFLASALAPVALPGFVLYMNRFQIRPEESALTALFGEQFVAYKSRVRRWL